MARAVKRERGVDEVEAEPRPLEGREDIKRRLGRSSAATMKARDEGTMQLKGEMITHDVEEEGKGNSEGTRSRGLALAGGKREGRG